MVGGEDNLDCLSFIVNGLLHTDRPLPRLPAGGVAQQRPEHPLYAERVPAVETEDHPQVGVGATALAQGRSDAEDPGDAVLDALYQGPETVLYHGPLLDLVPVLVQEGTVQRIGQVLTLLSQPQTVLL